MRVPSAAALAAALSLIAPAIAVSESAKNIVGTPGDDVLPGTAQRDTIRGLAGNDTITPGKDDGRAFGDEGGDRFNWKNGDGHDRIDGGADPDSVSIDLSGKPLRLHIDALGTGPEGAARDDLQVIGVAGLEGIGFVFTDGAEPDSS